MATTPPRNIWDSVASKIYHMLYVRNETKANFFPSHNGFRSQDIPDIVWIARCIVCPIGIPVDCRRYNLG
jgi:hypothetical protein